MRILLVEDDDRISRFISKGLKENAYAVDRVSDGDSAIHSAEVNDYDLVILDVMIPVRDGFEVCEHLRSSEIDVPVLMLTARDAVEDRIAGLDKGADDYLTKPFEFGELLARVRALLRRPRGEMIASTIRIADLEVDTRSQTAYGKGEAIDLTTKEYALLEYFARNAGRVIGREEISEHVWNENFDPFSNLIEVYVNRLRRKLLDGIDDPSLQTRRGAGYILVSEESDGREAV
ncbi:MAG: DNA-binding response regulator [Acidobacteria bacterium]|nr:MAG: DNA-binding response regulator [Acidobacteriota bacterium]REJ98897.1 MAG: DNA-binding response regulator [Acidobacteriota bacterium]REK16383.1 MAG: DNA-binding response regulator [Acidobacteriota bacterium]REK44064.1 MAG: DNA-binding response regulator [Acidobacteriota bacterium]